MSLQSLSANEVLEDSCRDDGFSVYTGVLTMLDLIQVTAAGQLNLLMRMRAIRKKSASSFHVLFAGLPPEGTVQVRMGFPSSTI